MVCFIYIYYIICRVPTDLSSARHRLWPSQILLFLIPTNIQIRTLFSFHMLLSHLPTPNNPLSTPAAKWNHFDPWGLKFTLDKLRTLFCSSFGIHCGVILELNLEFILELMLDPFCRHTSQNEGTMRIIPKLFFLDSQNGCLNGGFVHTFSPPFWMSFSASFHCLFLILF